MTLDCQVKIPCHRKLKMRKNVNEKIGAYVQRVMINNPDMKNASILDLVKSEFPEAKTSPACIAWYRSDLKKSGKTAQPAERTVEVIDSEILDLEQQLEALRGEREEVLKNTKEARALKKAELEAQLKMLAELEAETESE